MAIARDHKVRFRSEETIAALAHELRTYISARSKGFATNVATFIQLDFERFSKVPVTLDIFQPSETECRKAYVTYNPLTLHVVRGVWRDAQRGGRDANYVLAHELGHLVLHDHFAQAFSEDESEHLRAWPQEERAEWQANTFAEHFLVPDEFVSQLADASTVATSCDVSYELALDRVESFHRFGPKYMPPPSGDKCPKCGSSALLRTGVETLCPCGYSKSDQ